MMLPGAEVLGQATHLGFTPGQGGVGLVSAWTLFPVLGLSLFFGLAFEEVYAEERPNRPGGVRTFPLLALAGFVLWVLEPVHGIAFAAGLLVIGAWLGLDYRTRLQGDGGREGTGAEIVIPLCNILAYLLGPGVLLLPAWASVTITVAAVLLLGARDALHALARRVSREEILTAGKFLILVGVVLPLLPAEPVTHLSPITPRQVWLGVVVISTLSYGSYLVQRFVWPGRGPLVASVLGGLYSSTATTVVLARQGKSGTISARAMNAGMVLATALMYVRLGVVVAVFNWRLALTLAPPLAALALAGGGVAWILSRGAKQASSGADQTPARNPLELGAALTFAILFVVISIVSTWAAQRFGSSGVYALAGIVGVTDIDPFVLSVAQGGVKGMGLTDLGVAVIIAASSNNVLKAVYAIAFGGRRQAQPAAAALVGLAVAGMAAVLAMVMLGR